MALARVEVVRGVQQMQTSLRAALQRRKHHELRKEMRYVQPDVTRLQAAIRGALVRAEFRWWAQHLVQSEPVAVHLQALVRGTLARRAFRRAFGHYLSRVRDVITVQSVVRAHLQGLGCDGTARLDGTRQRVTSWGALRARPRHRLRMWA